MPIPFRDTMPAAREARRRMKMRALWVSLCFTRLTVGTDTQQEALGEVLDSEMPYVRKGRGEQGNYGGVKVHPLAMFPALFPVDDGHRPV